MKLQTKQKLKVFVGSLLGEGKELHLISILKENVTINKALHFALTTSNFDAFIKALDNMKISYSDWPGTPQKINIRADGIKQIYFQDPDGNWIEINSVMQKLKFVKFLIIKYRVDNEKNNYLFRRVYIFHHIQSNLLQ